MTIALALCGAPAWSAAQTSADHAGMTFVWRRAAGAERCVSQAELEARVREALTADGAPAKVLVVDGTVRRDEAHDGFQVSLRVMDGYGKPLAARDFASDRVECTEVTSSIVLVTVLLIELGAQAPVEPPAAPVGADVPIITAPPLPEPATAAAPPNTAVQHRWEYELELAAGLALGLHPGPSVGPALRLQVSAPHWLTWQVRGGYWSAGTLRVRESSASAVGADFQVFALQAAVCLRVPNTSRWRLAGCVGPDVVLRIARLFGFDEHFDSTRATPGANASLQTSFEFSDRWLVTLDATLFAFGNRDRYVYEDAAGMSRPVFVPSHVASVISLGLGARL